MSSEIGLPLLHWRTLGEIYQYYLGRTRSEDFLTAAEVIQEAETKIAIARVAIPIQVKSGSMTQEKADEVSTEIEEMQAQAERMRRIALHRMTQEAAEGVWFAVGQAEPTNRHQLIHPSAWNFLIVDIKQGAAWRQPSLRFDDLRCAFTIELPAGHPLARDIQQAVVPSPRPTLPAPHTPVLPSPPLAADLLSPNPRTGAPGRPSSMHLVEKEFERRVEQGHLLPSLKAQAQALHQWFKTTHHELPPPTSGTIENRIRSSYRQAKITRKTTKL